MKRKLILSIIAILSLIGKGFAQQDPLYSLYMYNAMSLNPAYAGSYDDVAATLLYRNQWVGFAGAPKTAGFNIHSPYKKEKMGLGLSFQNDKFGSINQNYLSASYAYHLKFKKSRLAFGLQGVLQNFSAALSKLQTSQQGIQDNAFKQDISVFGFNAGAGVFWYGKNYYAGASVPHLIPGNMEKKLPSDPQQAKQKMHAYLIGGYIWDINPIWKLKPNFLMKYAQNSPPQFDINVMAYMYNQFGLGAGYRTGGSAVAMAEIVLPAGFKLAYAYDYSLSELVTYNSGSHEFVLQYRFGFDKNKITSPRFF